MRCGHGHNFDLARQGYLNLLAGHKPATTGDDAAMVAARLEFLDGGHYAPLAHELAARVAEVAAPGAVLDSGCGTGYYLSAALPPGRVGLGLDVSVAAARRAARVHPDAGVVVADSWRPLPVRDQSIAVVLDVFAPRNAPEFARVLHPGGRLIVATPAAGHLAELIAPLGMLGVDEHKQQRLAEALSDHFVLHHSRRVDFELDLDQRQVATLVAMTPSAHHVDPDRLRGLASGRSRWQATASIDVASYVPSG